MPSKKRKIEKFNELNELWRRLIEKTCKPVAAAASIPFSSTVMKVLCTTSDALSFVGQTPKDHSN